MIRDDATGRSPDLEEEARLGTRYARRDEGRNGREATGVELPSGLVRETASAARAADAAIPVTPKLPSHQLSKNEPVGKSDPRASTVPPTSYFSPGALSTSSKDKKTSATTLALYDLLSFLKVLPSPIPLHWIIPRVILRFVARLMAKRNMLASNIAYDLLTYVWKLLLNVFFREIRPRGSHKIPRDGALIFCVGPHHNQFLDPLVLLTEVRKEAKRRVSFLIAEKSLNRKFIGLGARLMQSISVSRAQDKAQRGKGIVFRDSHDECKVLGEGTMFKSQLEVKGSIQFPSQYQSECAEITEIVSDSEIRIRKPLKDSKLLEDLNRKGDGVSQWKALPFADQTAMYKSVFDKLNDGGTIGIFPEGGSHDRTEMLPLKAGITIMALGAMAKNPELKVRIQPCGLNYFHPHRFRSRGVIEFGTPIDIPKELVDEFKKGGKEKREACGKLLQILQDSLRAVTTEAPDYETLMVLQAARRLYRPAHRKLAISHVVELNRRFMTGYLQYKDEPRVVELRDRVLAYNQLLRYHGLKDHQVEVLSTGGWRAAGLLVYRSSLLLTWGVMALPGALLNAPIFITASIISAKKAREALAASTVKIQGRDVLATWKVLVFLGLMPVVYTSYTVAATVLAFRYNLQRKYKFLTPFAVFFAVPILNYAALNFGEVGMDIYKSLRPLFLSLMPGDQQSILRLRKLRNDLSQQIQDVVEEFGPKIFPDFDANRVILPRSASQASLAREQPSIFGSPIEWLGTRIFSEDEEGRDFEDALAFAERETRQESVESPERQSPVRSRAASRSGASDHQDRKMFHLSPSEPPSPVEERKGSLLPQDWSASSGRTTALEADQQTSATAAADGSAGTSASDARRRPVHVRSPRSRTGSLGDAVPVSRFSQLSRNDSFSEVTQTLNKELDK